MKSLLGVLSLVLVLVYSQADVPAPYVCPETRNASEIQHLGGDWVLVYAAYDKQYQNSMPNMTSSFVEITVECDGHTLLMKERTVYGEGKCAQYIFLSHDLPDDGHLHLELVGGTENKDGMTKVFKDEATMDFYPSGDHALKMHYKGKTFGSFLLIYRRAGQHIYHLEEDNHDNTELAKCLHLHGDNFEEWHYHGHDFCHKSSVLPTLDDHDLHQVEGNWVLVWMVYDKTKEEPYSKFSSSLMHIDVHDDNHTLDFHELNHLGDKCVEYTGHFILPNNTEKIHQLHMEGATEHIDGKNSHFNDSATVEFFPSPDNIMEMFYKSLKYGKFLLEYRREGHHKEVEGCERDKHHEEHLQLAKYLGLTGDHYAEWHYDGKSELCHKKADS